MSRGPGKITMQLVEVIEDGLAVGAGDLSPTLDDLRIRFSARTGFTLDEAKEVIVNRIDSALAILEDRGWPWCKFVRYYAETYKGQPADHPKTDAEISRCVAGSGVTQPTFGVHFHVPRPGDTEPDCELWMKARILGIENGDAKRSRNIRRVRTAIEEGDLSIEGAKRIASKASVEPDTAKRLRQITG